MPGSLPVPHINPLFPDDPDAPTTALFQGLTDHSDIYQPQSLLPDGVPIEGNISLSAVHSL